nr:MAG TPA: hypothetical protein [Inoviridae sp.]
MNTPLMPCRRPHTLPQGQVVRRALFAPSPCPRGVASETGGRGGLVPRKGFRFSIGKQKLQKVQLQAAPPKTSHLLQ